MAVTSLPIDVLIAILAFLAVPDLANLARSSQFFRDFVSHACESLSVHSNHRGTQGGSLRLVRLPAGESPSVL